MKTLFDLSDRKRRYLLWKLQVEALQAIDARQTSKKKILDPSCTKKCPKCGCQGRCA